MEARQTESDNESDQVRLLPSCVALNRSLHVYNSLISKLWV